MPLSPGTRLGPYEVLAPLGAGGMGEVWRARDTRLGRDVAVKVLPDDLASDRRALTQFESEARAVAALSHPNILALFDVGEANGVRYAVTELLEGEALREVILRGPVPLRRALEISGQIANGLSAAHGKGIVHRDIKPENVFLAKEGEAKILDFGLARQTALPSDPDFTASPTSDPFTGTGAVVGTVAYMSPEQASGRPVDHRSDQFSLGVVLYEMFAGRRPFKGPTAAETLTSIIREEPEPLETCAPGVPAPVRWIVERCLAKEAGGRYESTRDLARDLATWRLHLAEATSPGRSGIGGATPPVSRRHSFAFAAVAAAGVALGLGAGVSLDRQRVFGGRTPGVPSPTFQRLTTFEGIENWPSLSPDGKTIAYQKSVNGKSDVYVLRVGGVNPANLTASLEGDCDEPAFSPDGRLIAFRSEGGGGGIFLMGATGESARRLTEFGHTPAWFPDGRRLAFATETQADPSSSSTASELWIADVESGARRKLPVAGRAYQPSVSPHGARIAFWGLTSGGGRRDILTIGSGDDGSGPSTQVTADAALDWSPFWSGDGRFLYFASDRGGSMNLWRVGIDETSGKVGGEPEPVTVPASWAGPFRATPDGSRVVFTSVERERTLERLPIDPGSATPSGAPTHLLRLVTSAAYPRVSPRGDLLTFTQFENRSAILVLKTDGSGLRSLTDDGFRNRGAGFSPDGRKIVFYSDRTGTYELWVVDVDGSSLKQVTRAEGADSYFFPVWSPDGRTIAAGRGGRVLLIPVPRSAEDSPPEPCPALDDDLRWFPGSWSPDSRYVAGWIVRPDGEYSGIVIYDTARRTYRRARETGRSPLFLRDGGRIAFQEGNTVKILDTASGRVREILRGDARRRIGSFGLAPDDTSLFVFWQSTQADLWLMDLGERK